MPEGYRFAFDRGARAMLFRAADGRRIRVGLREGAWGVRVRTRWVRSTRPSAVRAAADKLDGEPLRRIAGRVTDRFWCAADEAAVEAGFPAGCRPGGRSGAWALIADTRDLDSPTPWEVDPDEAERVGRWVELAFDLDDLRRAGEAEFDRKILVADRELQVALSGSADPHGAEARPPRRVGRDGSGRSARGNTTTKGITMSIEDTDDRVEIEATARATIREHWVVTLPDGFEDWSEDEQRDWLTEHADECAHVEVEGDEEERDWRLGGPYEPPTRRLDPVVTQNAVERIHGVMSRVDSWTDPECGDTIAEILAKIGLDPSHEPKTIDNTSELSDEEWKEVLRNARALMGKWIRDVRGRIWLVSEIDLKDGWPAVGGRYYRARPEECAVVDVVAELAALERYRINDHAKDAEPDAERVFTVIGLYSDSREADGTPQRFGDQYTSATGWEGAEAAALQEHPTLQVAAVVQVSDDGTGVVCRDAT
jgi:hypothetical protein